MVGMMGAVVTLCLAATVRAGPQGETLSAFHPANFPSCINLLFIFLLQGINFGSSSSSSSEEDIANRNYGQQGQQSGALHQAAAHSSQQSQCCCIPQQQQCLEGGKLTQGQDDLVGEVGTKNKSRKI